MKTVMSGIALAAILALAMPAWAQDTNAPQQNTGGQQSTAPATGVSSSHAKKTPATRGMHARKISHKNTRHVAMRHRTTVAHTGSTAPTDNMANQLNRQENQRLSGSSTPPMAGPTQGR